MSCPHCKSFLFDFLNPEIHKDLDLAKRLHIKRLPSIRFTLVDWIHRIFSKIKKEDFDSSLRLALCIAQRGRKAIEYEFVVSMATFRLMKAKYNWLEEEIRYIKVLLSEACIIKKCHKTVMMTYLDDYVSYITSRSLTALFTLHDDHLHPKGLYTNTNQLLHKETDTVEIFEVIEVDDLYF